MMNIIEIKKIDEERHDNVTFIRIEPENLSVTILDIINALADMSWISRFVMPYTREAFEVRARQTADYLEDELKKEEERNVIKNSGEYIVSELGRQAMVQGLHYMDVPLAELFKEKVIGNPGFDFYSANQDKIIVFGEAKYSSSQNAYGRGMEQVDRFINEKQDISDIEDIDKFFDVESLIKAVKGEKAYAVAFSSKQTESEKIIKGIINNHHYDNLVKYNEVVFLAVNI